MPKQPEYYDQDKLYEKVWAEPVSKVARRYGVSNVAIAKTCRKMRIPVPGVGYWNKVGSGQKMKKLALPAFETCPKVQRYFIRSEEIEEKKVERLVVEAFALEDQLIQRESSPGMEIICDPVISLTDRYVQNTVGDLVAYLLKGGLSQPIGSIRVERRAIGMEFEHRRWKQTSLTYLKFS